MYRIEHAKAATAGRDAAIAAICAHVDRNRTLRIRFACGRVR